MFAVCCLLLCVERCSLLCAVCVNRLLLGVCCMLFAVCCSLRVGCSLMSVSRCSLFVVCLFVSCLLFAVVCWLSLVVVVW